MALKKRVTNFVSNWLGVLIAVAIVAVSAAFGGMYLYARSRLDNTLNLVTQIVTLPYNEGFVQTGTVENPPGNTYHIKIQVYNLYNDTVEVAVSDISIKIDSFTFPMSQNGQWSKSVPTGYAAFEGDITIDKETLLDLIDRGPVDLVISGNISASGQYSWVKRQTSREFTINIPDVRFELASETQP